jgi:hypothetical protein
VFRQVRDDIRAHIEAFIGSHKQEETR